MKVQFIAMVSLFFVMGCSDDESTSTTSTGISTTTSITTSTTETGTTSTTETSTTSTTETGTTSTTETGTSMTTETGTTGTTTTSTGFSPTEGVWAVTMMSFTSNGCNLEDDGGNIALGLMNIDADRFWLRDMEDPAISFLCTNAGAVKAYECSSVLMSDKMKPLDAVITSTITPEVMFSSETSGEMPFDFAVECVGSDCAKVTGMAGMAIPCLTEATFEIEKKGP